MPDTSVGFVKTEIAFFMEKIFQITFVYLGALFAALVGARLEAIRPLASILGSSEFAVLSTAVLALNLSYLVLVSSCTFAVIKRGYFILQRDDAATNAYASWERFVRRSHGFSGHVWNIDNYYIVPVYLLIFSISTGFFIGGAIYNDGLWLLFTWTLGTLHFLPVWILLQTERLNKRCHGLAKSRAGRVAETSLGSN